jgi:hypothetical protein
MSVSPDKLTDEKRGAWSRHSPWRAEAMRRRLGEGGILHGAEDRLHREIVDRGRELLKVGYVPSHQNTS